MTHYNSKIFYGVIIACLVLVVVGILVTRSVYVQKLSVPENRVRTLEIEKSDLQDNINELQVSLQDKEAELTDKTKELEDQKSFFDTYIKGENEFGLGVGNGYYGDYYYQLASYSYEDTASSYQDVIDNCVQARTYYNTASQNYLNAEALYKKAKGLTSDEYWDSLADKSADLSDSASKIALNMYEACEYFETASLNYGQGQMIAGDGAIESMNKKIAQHDKEVLTHNKILAQINAIMATSD